MIYVTLIGNSSGFSGVSVAATPYDPPKQRGKADGLPSDVRRENQEPGNPITSTDLAAYGAEKIAKSMPAIRTENLITDKKDGDRKYHHSDKEQTEKQAQLAERGMS